MKALKPLALLLVSALPFAVACQKSAEIEGQEVATQTSEQEIPGTNQPNDLSPTQAQTMVDDVTIGHKAGPDGTIAAADQGDDFAPGDPVVIAMKVGDAPPGSMVKVIWYGPNDTKLSENEKGINAGSDHLIFENLNTASLATGDYRAEVWIGDEKVDQQSFNIVERSATGG